MDNFLGTLVFLLPGVLAYFWLQAFGISPVTKHTPTEFAAVAALLWLPVSVLTIGLYNSVIKLAILAAQSQPIWTMNDLKNASGSFVFLTVFLMLSIIVSFILSWLWAKWGYNIQQIIVNKVRKSRGLADFSENTTVWDEVFSKNEPQVVEIGKIGSEPGVIGCIRKASRPFEPERNLMLDDIELLTTIVTTNKLVPIAVYSDIKSGTVIKIYDSKRITELISLSVEPVG
jgi:hypothetical protein